MTKLNRPSGLQEDCPFEGHLLPSPAAAAAAGGATSPSSSPSPPPEAASSKKPAQFRGGGGTASGSPEGPPLIRPEDADRIDDVEFQTYCSKLYSYLQVLSQ